MMINVSNDIKTSKVTFWNFKFFFNNKWSQTVKNLKKIKISHFEILTAAISEVYFQASKVEG